MMRFVSFPCYYWFCRNQREIGFDIAHTLNLIPTGQVFARNRPYNRARSGAISPGRAEV